MIRNPSIVREIYDASNAELAALSSRRDLSSYLLTTQMLSKSMLLSCASFYEQEIVQIVERVIRCRDANPNVTSWLLKTAVEGQFYKWFDFRHASNTNRFLSMFGAEFKECTRALIESRERRKAAEESFLLLCIKRNECVHRNFAAYNLDLTIDEIYKKHMEAMSYIRVIDVGTARWLENR